MTNYKKGSAVVGVVVFVALVLAAGAAFYAGTQYAQPTPGSVVGPDSPNPYYSVNGVATWKTRVGLRTATTTLCAIKSPAATSTLDFVSLQIAVGTSTAATIDLATSTTAYATTTNLVSAYSVGSGAQGASAWKSSGTNAITAPNTYFVAKTAGAGLGGYTYVGSCEASFTVL